MDKSEVNPTGPAAPYAQDASDALFAGEVLGGNFEVLGLLGSGGMGQVFEAYDRAFDRRVAIKVASGDAIRWLRREATAMAAIGHACVPAVHTFGIVRAVEYLVMERIYGLTLAAHLDALLVANTRFTVSECIDVLVALTDGVAAVHRVGVIHADIKPENIMLATGQRVVLLDFGVFRSRGAEGRQGTLAGSPIYMAPEAIGGWVQSATSHRVDLYAVGVVAFEMLAGQPPFDGATCTEILQKHLDLPAPELTTLRPEVPPALADLVRRLLAKDPAQRPMQAESVWWELRAIQAGIASGNDAGPATVFIVDDDPDSLALLQLCAERAAREAIVRVFSSAEEALEAVRQTQPDVMLVDLRMPGMSGLELCLYMRGTHLADRCRIIALSGSVDDGEIELLRQLGISQFVRKGPALAEQLAELIRGDR